MAGDEEFHRPLKEGLKKYKPPFRRKYLFSKCQTSRRHSGLGKRRPAGIGIDWEQKARSDKIWERPKID